MSNIIKYEKDIDNIDDGYKDSYPTDYLESLRTYGTASVFIDTTLATPEKVAIWIEKYPKFKEVYLLTNDIQISFINRKIVDFENKIGKLVNDGNNNIDNIIKVAGLFKNAFDMSMKAIELENIKVNKQLGKNKTMEQNIKDSVDKAKNKSKVINDKITSGIAEQLTNLIG